MTWLEPCLSRRNLASKTTLLHLQFCSVLPPPSSSRCPAVHISFSRSLFKVFCNRPLPLRSCGIHWSACSAILSVDVCHYCPVGDLEIRVESFSYYFIDRTLIFFTERVVNVWNSLPNTVNFNALAVFKRTIKCVNFTSNLWFSCRWYVSTICWQLCKCTFVFCCPVRLLFDFACYFIAAWTKEMNEWMKLKHLLSMLT